MIGARRWFWQARGGSRRLTWAGALVLAMSGGAFEAAAEPRQGPSVIVFGGQMTDNHWEETFLPWNIELLDSWFIGVGVGYEWPTRRPSVALGVEAQVVGHFGRQDHLEFNLPLIIRYYPREPIFPVLDSAAFGIGLSTTTQDPQTEVDRDGETSKTLVYWMGELEFGLADQDTTFVFRLHHRSDAYGVFSTNSGSNALAFGVKHRF